jgi:hypothetical protein
MKRNRGGNLSRNRVIKLLDRATSGLNTLLIERIVNDEWLYQFFGQTRDTQRWKLNLFFLTVFPASLILLAFSHTPLIPVLFPLMWFFVIYLVPLMKKKAVLQGEKIDIDRTMPLLRLHATFIRATLPKTHDFLQVFITCLGSQDFGGVLKCFKYFHAQLLNGIPAEAILLDHTSISKELTNFLHDCTDMKKIESTLSQRENFLDYRIFLKSLESRLVIIIAESIFLPMISNLFFIFNIASFIVGFSLVLVHFILLRVMTKGLLMKRFGLFSHVDSVLVGSGDEIDHFITFFEDFGTLLKNNAPEYAYLLYAQGYTKTDAALAQEFRTNMIDPPSLDLLLSRLSTRVQSIALKTILFMLSRLQSLAGPQADLLLRGIASELRQQREIENERVSIVKGERFKIVVLVLCLPFMLAVISSIFPKIILASQLNSSIDLLPAIFSIPSGYLSTAFFFCMNAAFTLLSVNVLTRIVSLQNRARICLLSMLLFLAIFMITFSITMNGATFSWSTSLQS